MLHWKAVNELIEKAMAEGQFDNLAGMGRPLDLEDYFNTPEDLRLGYQLLKENGFRPTEVELFSEISRLRKKLEATTKPTEQADLRRRILEQETHLAIMQEKNRVRRD